MGAMVIMVVVAVVVVVTVVISSSVVVVVVVVVVAVVVVGAVYGYSSFPASWVPLPPLPSTTTYPRTQLGPACLRCARSICHQDMEPEYIAVTDDSKTAYVTLQVRCGIQKCPIKLL